MTYEPLVTERGYRWAKRIFLFLTVGILYAIIRLWLSK